MNNMRKLETTSFSLHLMAMLFMLCDHLWGTIVPGNDWLTCIGRIAFPIFAFLLVEGYFHTKNLKKYVTRLLFFALISELPFNLALGGRLFHPFHQNVLWSFLISIILIHWNERARQSGSLLKRIAVGGLSLLLGSALGLLTFVDYYHAGILTALSFYFFRSRQWWGYAGQLLCLWYINMEVLGGLVYPISFLNMTVFFPQQGLALLALPLIWLYQGRQGHHSKGWQYFCYAFYPAHLLILGLLKML